MNKCTTCAGTTVKTEIIPKYDAESFGAPFKVFLMNAVKAEVCSSCRRVLNTSIPDPEGLLYTISFERAMHPRKLTGAEIRFLRRIMGWRAKQMADQLGITVEHLSRCENAHVVMSVSAERLLRLLAVLRPGDEDKPPDAIVEAAHRDWSRKKTPFQVEPDRTMGVPLEFCYTHAGNGGLWSCR